MPRIVPSALRVCCGLLMAFAARAEAPAATVLPPVSIPYERFTLANGLTVVVHEDHKAPLVAVSVWYHVGSKDEPERRHGFAHLFEHLMFNGSQHYDDEYFRALEPAGVTDINGSTNVDRTEYHETVPTAALDLALWLESDRMGYLAGAIDQKKLDEQRGVVLNEKREGENRPYGKLRDLEAAASYPAGHPYSWTTIGNDDDLNAATLADVKAWFKRWYGPNNATLTLAGDITPAQAKTLAEKYFGGLPSAEPVSHVRDWPAPRSGDKRIVVDDRDVPLARLSLAWNIPGDGERDNVLLSLLGDVLSGKDGRLYERLVYRDQIATSVGAGTDGDEIGGSFEITALAKPGGDPGVELVGIEAALREELARIVEQGPTDAELQRQKTLRYAALVGGLDSVASKAGLLATNQVFHGDPGHYAIELRWLDEAKAADVQAAAKRWLSTGELAIEVHPQPVRKASAEPGVDRSRLPVPSTPAPLALPPFQRATLANGLKLLVVPRPGVPQVLMEAVFDAGRAADLGSAAGTAALTAAMLDEGIAAGPGNAVGTLDGLAFARRQSDLGASISASTTRESTRVSLFALKANLAPALDLYAAVLRAPGFPAPELANLKQRAIAGIAQEKASAPGIANRVTSTLLYGPDHAYTRRGVGDANVLAGITRDDLIAFRQRWLRPDIATLVIVGDTTLAEIRPLIESRLGDWSAPAEPLAAKRVAPVSTATAPRVVLIDKPGATQTLVMATAVTVPGSDPAAPVLETVNTILGGAFVSRLNLNLREGKHWSYGANSSVTETRGPQAFLAEAKIERAYTAPAMLEMRREFTELLTTRPPTPGEIDVAKRSAVLTLPGEFESASEVAGQIAELVELQKPDDWWNRRVPEIEAQTPLQIRDAAKKLMNPQALLWIVIGDLDSVEPAVRKLNFGPVQVLDADGQRIR